MFLVGEFLWATSYALASGADEAFVYDSLKQMNEEGHSKKTLARFRSFELSALMVAAPVGSAIALGHPLGATGAVLTLTCAYGLRRAKKKYGVVTMCIGGGQGISLVLESIH